MILYLWNSSLSLKTVQERSSTWIKAKFEEDRTVQNVHNKHSERRWILTKLTKQESVFEMYGQISRKSVQQTSHEIGICKSSDHCIFMVGKLQ